MTTNHWTPPAAATPAGSGRAVDQGGRGGFSRAYLYHLDRWGERAPCHHHHNLHHLNLMREVREALRWPVCQFPRFKAEGARGVNSIKALCGADTLNSSIDS
jgi:queuine tRNA-ribosyltransferase